MVFQACELSGAKEENLQAYSAETLESMDRNVQEEQCDNFLLSRR